MSGAFTVNKIFEYPETTDTTNFSNISFRFHIKSADEFSKQTQIDSSNNMYDDLNYNVRYRNNKWSADIESFKFNKPGVYRYYVTEIANYRLTTNGSSTYPTELDGKPITFDNSEYLLTVTVSDKDGTLEVSSTTLTKTKDKDGNELESPVTVTQADFENTLAVAELTPPTINKSVELLYKDKEFNTEITNIDYKFNIKLTSDNSKNVSYDQKSITISAGETGGSGKFPSVKFWDKGTYTFEISEHPSDYAAIDERVYEWTVKIELKDGKYVVTENSVKLKGDDQSDSTYNKEDNSITFENKYVNKFTFEPRVKKYLTNLNSAYDDEEIPKEYTFKITATGNNAKTAPMPENTQVTVTVGDTNSDGTATGEASFGVINFNGCNLGDSYSYQIEEIKPQDDKSHVQYDTNKCLLTINVENGKIKKCYKYGNKPTYSFDSYYYDFEFTNTLHDEENSHNAEIKFTKYIEGNDPDLENGRYFTFKLDPIGDAPAPNEGSDVMKLSHKKSETTWTDSSIVTFTNQTGTYQYKFYEIKGDIPQYAYDSKVYTIEVAVSHGYVDSVKYFLDGREVDKIEFTNTYLKPTYIPTGINTNATVWVCTLLTIGGAMALMIKKRKSDK